MHMKAPTFCLIGDRLVSRSMNAKLALHSYEDEDDLFTAVIE